MSPRGPGTGRDATVSGRLGARWGQSEDVKAETLTTGTGAPGADAPPAPSPICSATGPSSTDCGASPSPWWSSTHVGAVLWPSARSWLFPAGAPRRRPLLRAERVPHHQPAAGRARAAGGRRPAGVRSPPRCRGWCAAMVGLLAVVARGCRGDPPLRGRRGAVDGGLVAHLHRQLGDRSTAGPRARPPVERRPSRVSSRAAAVAVAVAGASATGGRLAMTAVGPGGGGRLVAVRPYRGRREPLLPAPGHRLPLLHVTLIGAMHTTLRCPPAGSSRLGGGRRRWPDSP